MWGIWVISTGGWLLDNESKPCRYAKKKDATADCKWLNQGRTSDYEVRKYRKVRNE